MSPVDFKKWPCRPVEFRGQGPLPRTCNRKFSNLNILLAILSRPIPIRFILKRVLPLIWKYDKLSYDTLYLIRYGMIIIQ